MNEDNESSSSHTPVELPRTRIALIVDGGERVLLQPEALLAGMLAVIPESLQSKLLSVALRVQLQLASDPARLLEIRTSRIVRPGANADT